MQFDIETVKQVSAGAAKLLRMWRNHKLDVFLAPALKLGELLAGYERHEFESAEDVALFNAETRVITDNVDELLDILADLPIFPDEAVAIIDTIREGLEKYFLDVKRVAAQCPHYDPDVAEPEIDLPEATPTSGPDSGSTSDDAAEGEAAADICPLCGERPGTIDFMGDKVCEQCADEAGDVVGGMVEDILADPEQLAKLMEGDLDEIAERALGRGFAEGVMSGVAAKQIQTALPMKCGVCGCTDLESCAAKGEEPCHWVAPNLCSRCAAKIESGN